MEEAIPSPKLSVFLLHLQTQWGIKTETQALGWTQLTWKGWCRETINCNIKQGNSQ